MSQNRQYSNLTALLALTRASLQSTFKSPSAIVFTVAFPMVFILVFGFLSGNKLFTIGVAASTQSDTTNSLYRALQESPALKWVPITSDSESVKLLSEGKIAALIKVEKASTTDSAAYHVHIESATSQMDKLEQLKAIIKMTIQDTDPIIKERTDALANITTDVATIREFKTIDFILPGQLGFSLLAGSVFGTAFIFLNLRDTLVLKRFFSTPVRREVIVLSEGIARMMFQLLGAIVIISAGYFFFDYTLVNGFVTFLQMILLCALGIMVFMGFGFIISGIAKTTSTIPPLSNLVTLPQFLLAGTFFPIDVFPTWLQPFCRILPLTYLNDALRKIAFDNAGFAEIRMDILVLMIWGVVLYAIASKLFKWE